MIKQDYNITTHPEMVIRHPAYWALSAIICVGALACFVFLGG